MQVASIFPSLLIWLPLARIRASRPKYHLAHLGDSAETEQPIFGAVSPRGIIGVKKKFLDDLNKHSRGASGDGFHWMERMWETKVRSGEGKWEPNPLSDILGDEKSYKGSLSGSMDSGIHELETWNPSNEPPAFERFEIYKWRPCLEAESLQAANGGVVDISLGPRGKAYWDARGIAVKDAKIQGTGVWAMQAPVEGLDADKTIVIGNGGFGGSGGIEFLARKYNKWLMENNQEPIDFVYFGADSNQNMRAIEKVDLAITYEPVLEQRLINNEFVREVSPFFTNYFGFIIPKSDPLGVQAFFFSEPLGIEEDPGAVLMMMYIILKGLLKPETPTYASRWNFSAMGLRDHLLMLVACQLLARMLCNAQTGEFDISDLLHDKVTGEAKFYYSMRFLDKLQREVTLNRIALFQKFSKIVGLDKFIRTVNGTNWQDIGSTIHFCGATENPGDELYLQWHDKSVSHHRDKYPWQIAVTAMRSGQYHMNDLSFFFRAGSADYGELKVTDPASCNLGETEACYYQPASQEIRDDYFKNPLANPADLLLPMRTSPAGAAGQFFTWVKDNRETRDFWKIDEVPFPLFPKAIATITSPMAAFETVKASQVFWLEEGVKDEARRSRASIYYWAHTKF